MQSAAAAQPQFHTLIHGAAVFLYTQSLGRSSLIDAGAARFNATGRSGRDNSIKVPDRFSRVTPLLHSIPLTTPATHAPTYCSVVIGGAQEAISQKLLMMCIVYIGFFLKIDFSLQLYCTVH